MNDNSQMAEYFPHKSNASVGNARFNKHVENQSENFYKSQHLR